MTPADTLIEVAEQAFWKGQKDQEFRRIRKPGEFLMSLPPEIQRIFANMSSKEFSNVRLDAVLWMCVPPDPRYLRAVREHYEIERREYLKKHPFRSVDDEWWEI